MRKKISRQQNFRKCLPRKLLADYFCFANSQTEIFMLKMLLPLVILCGAIPCHADEITQTIHQADSDTEVLAMTYVGFGCGHIFLGQYSEALAAFEQAETQLATLEKREP